MRMVGLYESGELRHVERRLMARFSPPLSAEEVERCLVECIARFDGSSVRTYLSVLIERAAVDRLRAAVHDVDVAQHSQPSPVARALDARPTSFRADRRAAVGGV